MVNKKKLKLEKSKHDKLISEEINWLLRVWWGFLFQFQIEIFVFNYFIMQLFGILRVFYLNWIRKK